VKALAITAHGAAIFFSAISIAIVFLAYPTSLLADVLDNWARKHR